MVVSQLQSIISEKNDQDLPDVQGIEVVDLINRIDVKHLSGDKLTFNGLVSLEECLYELEPSLSSVNPSFRERLIDAARQELGLSESF